MPELRFTVQGKPLPKSVRFSKFGAYNSKPVRAWMDEVGIATRLDITQRYVTIPEGTPVSITLTFYLPHPKGTKKADREVVMPHTRKPDVDNLVKPVMDGISEAGLWNDDNQVWGLKAYKYWCKRGDERAEVEVTW